MQNILIYLDNYNFVERICKHLARVCLTVNTHDVRQRQNILVEKYQYHISD